METGPGKPAARRRDMRRFVVGFATAGAAFCRAAILGGGQLAERLIPRRHRPQTPNGAPVPPHHSRPMTRSFLRRVLRWMSRSLAAAVRL
jgi:hypothetical protein